MSKEYAVSSAWLGTTGALYATRHDCKTTVQSPQEGDAVRVDTQHRNRFPVPVLKQQLTSAPVLALPNFDVKFPIETDANEKGIGAILQQRGHPIAFVSKALCPRYQGLSTYEKEYLAIIVALDQWRTYLQHAEFEIWTDQKSLTHLEEQRLTTPWQHKAFTKLLGLRYRIRYKKGTDNTGAGALSRAQPRDVLATVTSMQPSWLEDVINIYNNNPHTTKLLEQLAIKEDPKGRF